MERTYSRFLHGPLRFQAVTTEFLTIFVFRKPQFILLPLVSYLDIKKGNNININLKLRKKLHANSILDINRTHIYTI